MNDPSLQSRQPRVGLWMIGASGGVGSTVALGLAALAKGLIPDTGLVTQLPPFQSANLVDPGNIVIGGHEIRGETLLNSVQGLSRRADVIPPDLIRACAPSLRSMQREIKPGTLLGATPIIRKLAGKLRLPADRTPSAATQRLASDIAAFQRRRQLDYVVVVNLASSEPPAKSRSAFQSPAALKRALHASDAILPTSCLYAIAAIDAGCGYINFTPSPGIKPPAIRALADQRRIPYMGSDGKTGETLVKSVLAPMFAMRNLRVLSWSGQNILGNRDGLVLRDPKIRHSKIASKDGLVQRIVGGSPTTLVSIDYLPSLDDWKIAWDFIHFAGFMQTKMSLQFIWQGCDSLLAAPLVIDLVRLTAREMQLGRFGAMPHLAFFFKDPLDVSDHDLPTQWQRLCAHLASSNMPYTAPLHASTIAPRASRRARQPRTIGPESRP